MNSELNRRLDEERELLEDLKAAMLEHHEALRAQEPERIGRALQGNLESVEACRMARERRDKHVADLLRIGGRDPAGGMKGLLEIYADGAARALREKIDGIGDLSRVIRIINTRNRELAEHGLDLLHGDFKVLAELVSETADRPGEDGGSGKLLSMRA